MSASGEVREAPRRGGEQWCVVVRGEARVAGHRGDEPSRTDARVRVSEPRGGRARDAG